MYLSLHLSLRVEIHRIRAVVIGVLTLVVVKVVLLHVGLNTATSYVVVSVVVDLFEKVGSLRLLFSHFLAPPPLALALRRLRARLECLLPRRRLRFLLLACGRARLGAFRLPLRIVVG